MYYYFRMYENMLPILIMLNYVIYQWCIVSSSNITFGCDQNPTITSLNEYSLS